MESKSKIPRLRSSLPSNPLNIKNAVGKLEEKDELVATANTLSIKKIPSNKTVSSRRAFAAGKYRKLRTVHSKYASYSNPKANLASMHAVQLPDEETLNTEKHQHQQVLEDMEKKLKDLTQMKHDYHFRAQQETAQINELDKEVAKLKFNVEELTRELQKERNSMVKEEEHQRTYEAELKLVNSELADLHKQEHLKQIKLKDLKNALAKIRGQQDAKSVSLDNRSEELLKVLRTHEAEVANVQAQLDDINTKLEQAKNEKEEKEGVYKSEISELNRKLENTQHQLLRANKAKEEVIKLYNFLSKEASKIMEVTGTFSDISLDEIKDSNGKTPVMTENEMKVKSRAFKMSLEHAQDNLVLFAKEKTRLIQVLTMENAEYLQLHLSRTEKFLENLRNETFQLRKNIRYLNNDLRNKSLLIKSLEDSENLTENVEHVKIKYLRSTLLSKMKRACDMEQRILRLKYNCKIYDQRIDKNKYLILVRDNLLQHADKTIQEMNVLKAHFRIVIDQHYLMSLKFNKEVAKLKALKEKLDRVKVKAKQYENRLMKMKLKAMFGEDTNEEWTDLEEIHSRISDNRSNRDEFDDEDEMRELEV